MPDRAAPDMTTGSAGTGSASGSAVLFSARPSALSYLYRYLLSFTPVMLVLVCIGVRGFTDSLFSAGSPMVPALFPVPAPPVSGGPPAAMAQYQAMLTVSTPVFGDLVAVLILLVVPVGIFLLGAGIGSSLRLTGMWTGPVLTLVLSAGSAYVLAGSGSLSVPYLVLFLQWIAFLVQPFSIVASVLVLSGTELSRRSLGYTITGHGIVIRGGIFRHVEQTIPHSRIRGVIFEQDLPGSWFNYGTLIPLRATSCDEGGAHGRQDTTEPGAFSGDRTGACSDPFTCLFGIPDPKTAQRILEKLIERPAHKDD